MSMILLSVNREFLSVKYHAYETSSLNAHSYHSTPEPLEGKVKYILLILTNSLYTRKWNYNLTCNLSTTIWNKIPLLGQCFSIENFSILRQCFSIGTVFSIETVLLYRDSVSLL